MDNETGVSHMSNYDDNMRALMTECDIPVSGIPGTGNCSFFSGIGKKWYRKKVLEPVSEKFGTKKVPVSVSKIFGTRKSIGIGIV